MRLLSKPRKRNVRRPRAAIKTTGSVHHLATRIFNVPLLIHQPKLEAILAVLGQRLGLRADMIPIVAFDDEDLPDTQDNGDDPDEPDSGVRVIPVYGTLVQRGGLNTLSGMTSYSSIAADFQEACADENCKSIVMDIDSPGGEVAGMFELARMISEARTSKPIITVSNEDAYSAAYCLASCGTRMLVGETAGVGSIGCYMLHCDQSAYDAEKGLVYTYVFSGDHKVDGNPHEPLSKDAKAKLQGEVDKIRDMFVSTVALNRGMDAKDVYDTEAGTYMGQDGVDAGLADEVGSLNDAIERAQDMQQTASKRSFLRTSPSGPRIELDGSNRMQFLAGAVPSHKTATSDKTWDGPANEARLKSPMSVGTAKRMYAWYDSSKVDSGQIAKSACSLPHHEVGGDGTPGAANVKGCQSAIGALNGARGGAKIPSADRQATYNHLAKHLKDAGVEPAPLKSAAELPPSAFESIEEYHQAHVLKHVEIVGVSSATVALLKTRVVVGEGIDPETAIFAVRALGTVGGPSDNKISGLLAPYNSLSCDLGGFKEVYQPGCFSEFLSSGEDALVLAYHNPENVLGRLSNGTARFWEEADGLHYEAELPDTQCARDLKTLIERGDVRGSSAAFYILQHRWEQRSSGRVRIVEKAKLVEGSPHSFVAYEDSTAQTAVQEDQLAATHQTELAKARLRRLRLKRN